MKRRTWRWVSLHIADSELVKVNECSRRPRRYGHCGCSCVYVCAAEFRRLFGFCPKPGEIMKVNFSAEVIPE